MVRDATTVQNLLTVDVEDDFMVDAFAGIAPPESWESHPSRVKKNTLRILDILDLSEASATFFVVGFVARRHPELVREIGNRGHEVACHGNLHRLVYDMTPEEFRSDTREARSMLEDIVGEPVIGYRAPTYSITERSLWALDVLIEEGFRYDSSIFPVHHDLYGVPRFERFPVKVLRPGSGGIVEFPLSTVQVLGRNVPVAGGGYLRIYPMAVTEWAIRRLNEGKRERAVVYLHPWEIDPGQPRRKTGLLSTFRHYANLEKTEERFRRLLGEFRFGPMRDAWLDVTRDVTL